MEALFELDAPFLIVAKTINMQFGEFVFAGDGGDGSTIRTNRYSLDMERKLEVLFRRAEGGFFRGDFLVEDS